MSSRSAESAGGDKPRLSDFKVLPEQRGVGPRVQKPEEPKQQPSTPDLTIYERPHGGGRRSGVARGEARTRNQRRLHREGSEQRGEPQPFQPNPAEQQATERLGKPPPQKEEEVVETLDPEVEEAIRQYGMAVGDPEEEAQLREQAKNDPALREFFKKGPISLTSSSLDLSIIRKPEDKSHS
jgi:hypothetical protein